MKLNAEFYRVLGCKSNTQVAVERAEKFGLPGRLDKSAVGGGTTYGRNGKAAPALTVQPKGHRARGGMHWAEDPPVQPKTTDSGVVYTTPEKKPRPVPRVRKKYRSPSQRRACKVYDVKS